MKYLPVYLFVGFITLILIVLPFIARDESQKIYLPGALEKKLLQKAERIHKKIQAALQTLKTRAAAEHIPPKTLISAQEAIARYGDRPGSQIADNYDDDSAPVLIYHGDLTLNGDLNSAWLQQQAAELHAAAYRNHIIIDGNLTLQGALLDDAALNLSVSGNVQADYLHSADGHLEILGDLDSALGISGAGNQGTLHIAGKIRAPYLLSQEHAMPREADNHDYIHIESGDIGYHPAKFDGSPKIPLDDSISGGNNGGDAFAAAHENAPWILREIDRATPDPVQLRILRDAKPGEQGDLVQDVPVSFNQEHRQYAVRAVVSAEPKTVENPKGKRHSDVDFMRTVTEA